MNEIELSIPEKFKALFFRSRYKVFYGGRGGGKSWAVAMALIVLAYAKPLCILCTREFYRPIKDSVRKLIHNCLQSSGLEPYFRLSGNSITCTTTGSEFIFTGLHHNITEIKSLEGVDICWVEEAQAVSNESWEILIPTIRKENSEIWVTFNPQLEDDDTYQRFVINPPKNAVVQKVNYCDNPFFPETLRAEMEFCRDYNPDDYGHIWLGECVTHTDAQIFRGKFEVKDFDIPTAMRTRWFIGADWGFSTDPTAVTVSFIQDDCLYIAFEAGGVGVELDEIPKLLDSIPNNLAHKWNIKADCARPETISHIRGKGYNIAPAKKWGGSVEDGIEHLKNFRKIYIHPNCRRTADEFRLYSYKVDRITGDVLPIVADKHNHYIDSLRYALDGYIKHKEPIKIPNKVATALRRGALMGI
jgi:phage terminase large subunit